MNAIPTVKIYLHKKEKKDLDGYIYIKVGIPGVKRYIPRSLGYRIPEAHWNEDDQIVKRSFPDSEFINKQVAAEKERVEDGLKILKKTGELSKETITILLSGKKGVAGSFLKFYLAHIDYLKTVKKLSEGYIGHFEVEYNTLEKFAGESLAFEDISVEFLRRYEAHLVTGRAKTTLNTKFKRLKEVIDSAIELRKIPAEAIVGFNFPTYEAPDRVYLTLEETDRIADMLHGGKFDDDSDIRSTACGFLVECYSGIRFSDWGQFTIEKLIDKDKLKVRTKKTGEPIYLPLHKSPRLKKLVAYIKKNHIKLDIDNHEANSNLRLICLMVRPVITKHVTTHIARHTCATLMLEIGYSDRFVAEILGVSLQTVAVYAKTTRRALNKEYEVLGGL